MACPCRFTGLGSDAQFFGFSWDGDSILRGCGPSVSSPVSSSSSCSMNLGTSPQRAGWEFQRKESSYGRSVVCLLSKQYRTGKRNCRSLQLVLPSTSHLRLLSFYYGVGSAISAAVMSANCCGHWRGRMSISSSLTFSLFGRSMEGEYFTRFLCHASELRPAGSSELWWLSLAPVERSIGASAGMTSLTEFCCWRFFR